MSGIRVSNNDLPAVSKGDMTYVNATGNTPRVSVIMGIYNCEGTLERAIDSILKQTFGDWELVMCDDGSADRTLSIARRYETEYPNKVRVLFNESNKKLSYSLNRCLAVSAGEYIARMDADDISLPDRLQKQVAFLDGHDEFALVSSRAIVFDEDGDRGIRGRVGEPGSHDLYFHSPFLHPTIMMRKSAYEMLGGYVVSRRTEIAQDYDLWFRFTAAGLRGFRLEEPLLRYHESADDYKRRTLRKAFLRAQTRFVGYRIVKAPIWCYALTARPVIAAMIPRRLLMWRRDRIEL